MTFNPFDKPIGEPLEANDLQALKRRRDAEGYFVESKEDFPSSTKIANNIASFASTYGGWYTAGVTTDENHVANNIPGFPRSVHGDPVGGTFRDTLSAATRAIYLSPKVLAKYR